MILDILLVAAAVTAIYVLIVVATVITAMAIKDIKEMLGK